VSSRRKEQRPVSECARSFFRGDVCKSDERVLDPRHKGRPDAPRGPILEGPGRGCSWPHGSAMIEISLISFRPGGPSLPNPLQFSPLILFRPAPPHGGLTSRCEPRRSAGIKAAPSLPQGARLRFQPESHRGGGRGGSARRGSRRESAVKSLFWPRGSCFRSAITKRSGGFLRQVSGKLATGGRSLRPGSRGISAA